MKIGKYKLSKFKFVINKNMPRFTDSPYWIEKDERSKAIIRKCGLPGMPPPQKAEEVSEGKK